MSTPNRTQARPAGRRKSRTPSGSPAAPARPAPTLLSFDSLQLVDAIARNGSFAAAAAELDRVPSAVTYAVRKLEDDLDVLLFDRRGYRARLTSAGEELLREGRHLLVAAEDLARRVQRVAEGWERELRIALDTAIAFDRLLPLLTRFCEEAPTQLRLSTEVLGGSWDALVSGRADLVIGASYEAPESSRLGGGLRTLPLGQIEMVFAVARTHPLAAMPAPLPLPELRRHRQIVVGDTSRRMAARSVGLLGAPVVLAVPTMEAKLAAQIAGLGVGYLPYPLAQEAIERGELVIKSTQGARHGASQSTTAHAAWRADDRGKALDWWLDELRKPATRAALLR
jgi:DNA-binding transcriptional LysR family regulator